VKIVSANPKAMSQFKTSVMEASHVSVSYATDKGPKIVLDKFSAEFCGGKIYVIMGRNGCGKSTLLKAIVGEIPLVCGEVRYKCKRGQTEQTIEYLPQNYREAIFPWKTVRDNIYPWDNMRHNADSIMTDAQVQIFVDQALFEFGLADVAREYPYKLSGGQQQLLLLARSVISQSSIIILDEPFSALDIVRRAVIAERLRQDWRGKGKVVICAMHEPDEAVTLADEVLFFSGTPMTIAERIEKGQSDDADTFRSRIINAIHCVADEGGYNA
jgi:NitT/TauT family transport system ATP-binding protein